jgi:hypothetical protein
MNDKSMADKYVDYLNENILPVIDYGKLHTSYGTDMVYAKGVLNVLHEAMVKIYGGERLDCDYLDDGYVVVPGVVRGRESGNVCLALLDLDLSSSGEHWGTDFLCKYGVVTHSKDSPAGKAMSNHIGVYDYCYTAKIPGDIHVSHAKLPKELQAILHDFRDYTVDSILLPDIAHSSEDIESNSEFYEDEFDDEYDDEI